jgi:hypothetical protein
MHRCQKSFLKNKKNIFLIFSRVKNTLKRNPNIIKNKKQEGGPNKEQQI